MWAELPSIPPNPPNPGWAPASSGAAFWFPGHLFFRARQPRKLCVQPVDGFGGGFSQGRWWPHGGGQWRYEPAAGSVVATGGPAAAGAQATQLIWGFVEQNIGVLGHGVIPDTTFISSGGGDEASPRVRTVTARTVIDFRANGRPPLSGTVLRCGLLPRSKSSTIRLQVHPSAESDSRGGTRISNRLSPLIP